MTPIVMAKIAESKRRVAHRQATCEHHGLFWYLATNEDGWRCVDCDWRPGDPAGFSPQHDRSHLIVKVRNILHDLHEAGFIYVSNGSHGEHIAATVATICDRLQLFDQYGIISRILLHLSSDHSAYWRRISEGVLTGDDKRDRCPCGALATSTLLSTPPQHRCSEHWSLFDEETDDDLRARLGLEVTRG